LKELLNMYFPVLSYIKRISVLTSQGYYENRKIANMYWTQKEAPETSDREIPTRWNLISDIAEKVNMCLFKKAFIRTWR
jgi:hypothetical protein